MHIAQVRDWSKGPEYITVPDAPAPTENQAQLRVLAAGLHQVVRSRASGQHYSASRGGGSGAGLPHNVGIDCVARDVATGELYYCMNMQQPGFGSFAEVITVDKSALYPLPASIDAESFAASVNPAMSSWLALKHRAFNLPENFTVLILGVTSASGRLAVRVAKSLGAGKVVGVARKAVEIDGLDEFILQKDIVTETDFSQLSSHVDVVLDYVYGDLAMHLLSTIKVAPGKSVQYVMIGGLSGQFDVPFPTAAMRSKDITVRGSGPGAISFSVILEEMKELVNAMTGWKLLDTVRGVPLKDIETVWKDKELQKKHRLVFIP